MAQSYQVYIAQFLYLKIAEFFYLRRPFCFLEPVVRAELMEQVPHIAMYCLEVQETRCEEEEKEECTHVKTQKCKQEEKSASATFPTQECKVSSMLQTWIREIMMGEGNRVAIVTLFTFIKTAGTLTQLGL